MTDEREEIVPKTRISVDGDLTAEKLLKLINLGAEEERLDYKTEYKLGGSQFTKDKVELVRDAVAMANTHGGYIVLGVREVKEVGSTRYVPEGLSSETLASLDISQIREQIESFVAERTDIQLQVHTLTELEGKTFAMIYVPPSQHSPIILNKDGQYKDSKTGESKTLFYSGDIVVRKGASTERVDQSDMRRLVSQIRLREKEKWTEEILGIRDLVQRLDTLITLLSGGSIPAQSNIFKTQFNESNLFLAPSVFQDHLFSLIQYQQTAAIRRYLHSASQIFFREISELTKADDNTVLETRDNRLIPILDNLTVMGIVFINSGEWTLLNELQKIFYQICKQANGAKYPLLTDKAIHFDATWIWWEVIVRVYALGGLLVYQEHFDHTPLLIRQEIEWESYYRKSFWSRYILIQVSRASRLAEKGIVRPTHIYVEQHPWMSSQFLNDQDGIAGSLCQFDYLQCVHVICETSAIKRAFPSFGIYNNYRTEPIVSKLISPGKVRDSIPKISDNELAEIISGLDLYAGQQYVRYNGWNTDSWSDERIRDFLRKNKSTA